MVLGFDPIQSAPPRVIDAGFFVAQQISVCLFVGMDDDSLFRALADPTRRAIFERLASGPSNASGLREGFGISQPAMSQHLGVLVGAGLVRQEREGRFVNYEVDPAGIGRIGNWLRRYQVYWPSRMADLDEVLREMDQ
ncbi:transcriptional regulator, ArsR family [Pelagibacterium halotolerans]|nr:transcriptional regulator, ArsR family [Pelagibacterium halotolerans]